MGPSRQRGRDAPAAHRVALLRNLVVKDLKLKYQRSLLGFAWSLLNPLLMMAVYSLVFAHVMRVQVPHYGIFLLEHRDDPASWLAVSLGAASTLLAFGLLALSSTPAVSNFGLAVSLGLAFSFMLAPWAGQQAHANAATEPVQ